MRFSLKTLLTWVTVICLLVGTYIESKRRGVNQGYDEAMTLYHTWQISKKLPIDNPSVIKFDVVDYRDNKVQIVFYTNPILDGGYIINAITEDDLKRMDGKCHGTTIFKGVELK